MKRFIKKYQHQFFKDITALGSFAFFGIVLLLILTLQEISLFFKLLFGLVFTLAAVVLIRIFYFKNRPRKEEHNNFVEKIDASSFPSLHTARAFFLAPTFIYLLRNNYATALLIALALLVSYSRVHLKKHDWWDLLGGTVLGLITFWLSKFF